MKHLFTIMVVALVTTLPAMAASADEGSEGASIAFLKAQSVFRAVELKWKVKAPYNKKVSFQILIGGGETYGPVSARPFFSLPAT